MHKKIFDDNYKKIVDALQNIRLSASDDILATSLKLSIEQRQNPAIARKIFDCITSGYSVSESLVITALHYDIDLNRARAVYIAHKNANRQRLAFAKNYLINTLKQRGFKIDDIALILGCTRQTVYNYQRRGFFNQ